MNTSWKRLISYIALPVAMAVMAPAQAAFIVDDFNTNSLIECGDNAGTGSTCPNTTIDGGTVWGGAATATRSIDANLLSGDNVDIEVCDNCQTAHLVADAGLTPSVGEYWFVWTGPSVDLSGGTLEFDWGADLEGTTWFADVGDSTGAESDSAVQAALPATPGPGSLTHTASISLSSFAGAVDLSDVTQLSLHFNGVGALDANIDDVRVAVPEPGVLALLSLSLLGLGWQRRRRAG